MRNANAANLIITKSTKLDEVNIDSFAQMKRLFDHESFDERHLYLSIEKTIPGIVDRKHINLQELKEFVALGLFRS
jgi:hypothetical protein